MGIVALALTKALDAVHVVSRMVIVCFYVAVVGIVIFQVFNRFWLQLPIVWTSDLAIICFIWLGFLTGAQAVRGNGHFRMTLCVDLAGEGKVRRALELFAILIGIGLFALLLTKGYGMAERGLREISPGLQIPMVWAYAALPVSAGLALLFYIEGFVKEISGKAAQERSEARFDQRGAL